MRSPLAQNGQVRAPNANCPTHRPQISRRSPSVVMTAMTSWDLMAGQAAILAGEYERAHAPLLRVILQDSLGLTGRPPRCLACDAFSALVASYVEEDSLDLAIRTARDWIRMQPGAGHPWSSPWPVSQSVFCLPRTGTSCTLPSPG